VAVSAKDKWAIEVEKRFGSIRVHSWPIDALPPQTAIDKELQKITTDAVGRRVVDKLVKVWLQSG
jgi:hypothetical protein